MERSAGRLSGSTSRKASKGAEGKTQRGAKGSILRVLGALGGKPFPLPQRERGRGWGYIPDPSVVNYSPKPFRAKRTPAHTHTALRYHTGVGEVYQYPAS